MSISSKNLTISNWLWLNVLHRNSQTLWPGGPFTFSKKIRDLQRLAKQCGEQGPIPALFSVSWDPGSAFKTDFKSYSGYSHGMFRLLGPKHGRGRTTVMEASMTVASIMAVMLLAFSVSFSWTYSKRSMKKNLQKRREKRYRDASLHQILLSQTPWNRSGNKEAESARRRILFPQESTKEEPKRTVV